MNQVIAKDERGLKYLLVNLPEDWSIKANRFESYSGTGYPFSFYLSALSPDNTQTVKYYNPINYRQDLQNNYEDNTYDDYGILHRSFLTVENFLDERAYYLYGEYDNFKFETQVASVFAPKADYAALTQKKFDLKKDKYTKESPNRIINSTYYYGATRVYSYVYKGTPRKVAYSALIDAEESTTYSEVEIPSSLLYDPLSMMMLKQIIPGIFRDQNGRYMHVADHSIYWRVSNRTLGDSPANSFTELYNGVYSSFSSGYQWHKELLDEMSVQQNAFDEKNRLKREEAKKASEIRRQAKMNSIKAAKEQADINRESSNQISQIINSTYDYKRKVTDKANQRFSDTFTGNQRYTDQYGDEHLVHSTDRYAFKKGNKIITSDDPRSPGFGWEELKKKG